MTQAGSVNGRAGRSRAGAGEATRQTRRRGTMLRLLALLRPESRRVAVVVVLAILSVGLSVAGPQILGHATDILFDGVVSKHIPAGVTKAQAIAVLRAEHHDRLARMFLHMDLIPGTGVNFIRLGQVLGIAVLVYFVSFISGWTLTYIIAGIALRTVFRLRQSVADKLGRLSLRYFDSHSYGDILSRVSNDTDNIFSTLSEGLTPLLISALSLAGFLGMMFWISPLLAPISLVTILFGMIATPLIARRSRRRFVSQWQRTGKLNGLVEETHTGHDLVLAFGQQRQLTEDFGRQNDKLYNTSFRAQFLSGLIGPVIQFIGNLNYVAAAVLGGYQVAVGAMSLGAVQAFIQYSRRLSIPVAQIGGQVNLLQSGLASAARVFEFLDVPEDTITSASVNGVADGAPLEGASLPELAPDASRIHLDHVCFRYEPDTPLIEDFTLDADPGQTIAIVGPTGAGKTTIVNLLMRFYEIDSGRILLDGVDYQNLSPDEVRRKFGMVLQDTWLFGGSIHDNIAYGKEGASGDEIVAAARAAYVDDFVRTMPDGYATVLDGETSGISAGQRQLLTIARAFLADPGILILDEATSNVDTRTEVLIQDAMARLRSGRTSFVIAHRLSTIRNADVIVVMDAGRVVEQGTHDELLRRSGFYHNLYNSQFSGVSDVVN